MKRIISIIMIFAMMFCFVSCKEKKASQPSALHTVDIENYAKKGEIPESKYQIGQNIDELKFKLTEEAADTEHAGENSYYFDDSGEEGFITYDAYAYYYKKGFEDKGITYLVSYEKAFGFESGTVILEVENVLKQYNYQEEDFNEKNSFFLYDPEGTILRVEFGKYTVLFAFVENGLSATAIYLTDDWK